MEVDEKLFIQESNDHEFHEKANNIDKEELKASFPPPPNLLSKAPVYTPPPTSDGYQMSQPIPSSPITPNSTRAPSTSSTKVMQTPSPSNETGRNNHTPGSGWSEAIAVIEASRQTEFQLPNVSPSPTRRARLQQAWESRPVIVPDLTQVPNSSQEQIIPTWTRYASNEHRLNVPDNQYADVPYHEPFVATTTPITPVAPDSSPRETKWRCGRCQMVILYHPRSTPKCDACGGRVLYKEPVENHKKRPVFLAR